MTAPTSPVRVAELMASLSYAADLGMGLPSDYALSACVVGLRLGDALGFDRDTLRDVYYETLLRYVGCNADVEWFGSLFGDELAFRAEYSALDTADTPAVLGLVQRSIRASAPLTRTIGADAAIARAMSELPIVVGSFLPGHCEVAQRLAQRMGFPASFVATVGQIYARWDGKGIPALAGDDISPAFLCASLAHDAVIIHRVGGADAAKAMARQRSGGAHAPAMVEVFCAKADSLLRGLERPPRWSEVLDLEPGPRRTLDDAALDDCFEAIADFADLKSPAFLGHSHDVAILATRAAAVFGLPGSDTTLLRRAALLHDVGKTAVSSTIWASTERLSDREWESVRLHPYHTGRVFARAESLSAIGQVAAMHHERLDGSGYHGGLPASMQSATVRLLVAANRFRALVEHRPHRAACSPEQAALQLREDARRKRLDADAVAAVLTAAGDRSSWRRKAASTALSEREIEVVRLLARGATMKDVATGLGIAYKTVDRHTQNIYAKIGVRTRAGATLWAVEHGLA